MAPVALDADVLIAFLDPGDAQHQRAVKELRAKLTAGERLLVGATVYAEVIVRPLALGTDSKVDEFLAAAKITVIHVDLVLAKRAAQLRARHRSLRLGDALSLATALTNDAQLLSFDQRLRRIAEREARAVDRAQSEQA
ncbi:MAG TPA: PIN domain-containing protein [Solirubrobacteraceae bacterium]